MPHQARITVPALTPAQKEAQKFAEDRKRYVEEYTRQLDEKAAREQEEEQRRREEEERRRQQQPMPLSIPPSPEVLAPLAPPTFGEFPLDQFAEHVRQQGREREWPQPWPKQELEIPLAPAEDVSKPTEFGRTLYTGTTYRNVSDAEVRQRERVERYNAALERSGLEGVAANFSAAITRDEFEGRWNSVGGPPQETLLDPTGAVAGPAAPIEAPPYPAHRQDLPYYDPNYHVSPLSGLGKAAWENVLAPAGGFLGRTLAILDEAAPQANAFANNLEFMANQQFTGLLDNRLNSEEIETIAPELVQVPGTLRSWKRQTPESKLYAYGPGEDRPLTMREALQEQMAENPFNPKRDLSFQELTDELLRLNNERPLLDQIVTGVANPFLAPWPVVGYTRLLKPLVKAEIGTRGARLLAQRAAKEGFSPQVMKQTEAGRQALKTMLTPGGMQVVKTAIARGDMLRETFFEMLESTGSIFNKFTKGDRRDELEAWLDNKAIQGFDVGDEAYKRGPIPGVVAGAMDFSPEEIRYIAEAGGIRVLKTGELASNPAYWAGKGLEDATDISEEQAVQFISDTLRRNQLATERLIPRLEKVIASLRTKFNGNPVNTSTRHGATVLGELEDIYGAEAVKELSIKPGLMRDQVQKLLKAEKVSIDAYQARIDSVTQAIKDATTDAIERGRVLVGDTPAAAVPPPNTKATMQLLGRDGRIVSKIIDEDEADQIIADMVEANMNPTSDAFNRFDSVKVWDNQGDIQRTWDFELTGVTPPEAVAEVTEEFFGAAKQGTFRSAINRRAATSEDYVAQLFSDDPDAPVEIARAVGLEVGAPPAPSPLPQRTVQEVLEKGEYKSPGPWDDPEMVRGQEERYARTMRSIANEIETGEGEQIDRWGWEGIEENLNLDLPRKPGTRLFPEGEIDPEATARFLREEAEKIERELDDRLRALREKDIQAREDAMERGLKAFDVEDAAAAEAAARVPVLPRITDSQIDLARNEVLKVTRESLDARGLPDEFTVWGVGARPATKHAPTSVFLSREAAQRVASRTGPFMQLPAEGIPTVTPYQITKGDVLADMGSIYPAGSVRQDELLVRGRNLRQAGVEASAAWQAPMSPARLARFVFQIAVDTVSPTEMRTSNFQAVNVGPTRGKGKWIVSPRDVSRLTDEPVEYLSNRAAARQALEESEQAFRQKAGYRYIPPQVGELVDEFSEMYPSAAWEGPPGPLAKATRNQRRDRTYTRPDEPPLREEPGFEVTPEGEARFREPGGGGGPLVTQRGPTPRGGPLAKRTEYNPYLRMMSKKMKDGQRLAPVTISQTLKERLGKPRQWWMEFQRAFTNVYAYADVTERQAEVWWLANRGEELPNWARPGMLASLHRGSPVYAHRRLNDLMDRINQVLGPGDGPSGYFAGTVSRSLLSEYLYNKHQLEILAMHPGRAIDVAGKMFPDIITKDLADDDAAALLGALHQDIIDTMREEHGPQVFERVLEAAEIAREEYGRMLNERVAEGLVRSEVGETLKVMYPFYHPLRYIETQGHAGLWSPQVSNRVQGVTTNDLHFLGEVGSVDLTPIDPLAMFDRTIMHHELAITINRATRGYVAALKALEIKEGQFARVVGQLLRVEGDTSTNKDTLKVAAESLWMPQYMSGTYVSPSGVPGPRVYQKLNQAGARVNDSIPVADLPPGVYSYAADAPEGAAQRAAAARGGIPGVSVDYVTDTPAGLVKEQKARVNKAGRVIVDAKPPAPGKTYVQYWENGIPKIFEVDDWVARDLESLSRFDRNLITRVVQAPQNIYRAAITSYNPAFMAMNWVFESMQLAVVHGIMPWTSARNLGAAIFDIFRDDEIIKEMAQQRGLVLGLTGKRVERLVEQATHGRIDIRTPNDWDKMMGSISKLMNSRLAAPVKAITSGVPRLAEAFEVGPRRALYTSYLDRGTAEAYAHAYTKYMDEELLMRNARKGMPEGRPTPARTYEAPVRQPWETGRPMRAEGEAISLPEVQSRAAASAEREVSDLLPGLKSRAAYEARTGMVDYQRWGHFVHLLDSVYLYLNAGVQGALAPLRYAVRPAKGGEARPLGRIPTPLFMRKRAAQTRLAFGVAGLQGVTTAVYQWNMQVTNERNNYYNIPMSDRIGGLVVLLPGDGIPDGRGGWRPRYVKLWPGREFAMLSGPLTYLYEAMQGKGHGIDMMALLGGVGPEINPVQAIAPLEGRGEVPFISDVPVPTHILDAIHEGYTNHDTFRNRAIIPESLKDANPEDQWDASTTDFSRYLGRKTGMSPMLLDHYGRVGVLGDMMKGAGYFLRKFDANEEHPILEEWAAELAKTVQMMQAIAGKEDPMVSVEDAFQQRRFAPEHRKVLGGKGEIFTLSGELRDIGEVRDTFLNSLPHISKDMFANRDKDMGASEVKSKVRALADKIMRSPPMPIRDRFYRNSASGRYDHARYVAKQTLGIDPVEQRKAVTKLTTWSQQRYNEQEIRDGRVKNYIDGAEADAGIKMSTITWKEERFEANNALSLKIYELGLEFPASSFALKDGKKKDYAEIMATLGGLWPEEAPRGDLLMIMWRSLATGHAAQEGEPPIQILDGALPLSKGNRRPIYILQDRWLASLSPNDKAIFERTRLSKMTPMERRWEAAKKKMKPYWGMDTTILKSLDAGDTKLWKQWLVADEMQRSNLQTLNPSQISRIQGDVSSLRQNMLYYDKELQRVMTLWGYINDERYLSIDELNRRASIPPPDFPAEPTEQPQQQQQQPVLAP